MRFSAISSPMNPPPTTTARRCLLRACAPVYESRPGSSVRLPWTHSRTAAASGTVRTGKMPGRSMPGSGGRMGAAPGESTSLS